MVAIHILDASDHVCVQIPDDFESELKIEHFQGFLDDTTTVNVQRQRQRVLFTDLGQRMTITWRSVLQQYLQRRLWRHDGYDVLLG